MISPFLLEHQPSLSDRAYEIVKGQIVTGQLQPGLPLRVLDVARQLGISRTPVTEAFNRLVAEALLLDVPRKGYFVSRLSDDDIGDLLQARLIVEAAAAEVGIGLVTTQQMEEMRRLIREIEAIVSDQSEETNRYAEFAKRDTRLHTVIVGTANNKHLADIHRNLSVHFLIQRTAFAAHWTERRAAATVREYRAILAAFEALDSQALKTALTEHGRNFAHSLVVARTIDRQGLKQGQPMLSTVQPRETVAGAF